MPPITTVIAAGVVSRIVELLRADDPRVQLEACWALANATAGGSSDELATLVRCGAIPALKGALTRDDPRVQVRRA